MIAPFDWWLLIVGLAAGAGLAWLVLADLRRREDDLDECERADEAAWIVATLEAEGRPLRVDAVEDVLALHRWYLREPPRFEAEGVDPEGVEEGPARLPYPGPDDVEDRHAPDFDGPAGQRTD